MKIKVREFKLGWTDGYEDHDLEIDDAIIDAIAEKIATKIRASNKWNEDRKALAELCEICERDDTQFHYVDHKFYCKAHWPG